MARGKHRDQLLEEGLKLFSTRGFAATGVQEITDAGGVPKGSFYNYFDSKEDFALEVLGRYRAESCSALCGLLGDRSRSPVARLRELCEAGIEKMRDTGFSEGCLAGKLAQELAGENAAFRDSLDQAFSCITGLIAECMRQARDAGEIPADADPAQLAEFFFAGWQGAMLRAKAAGHEGPLRAFVEVTFGRLLTPGPTPLIQTQA